MANKFGAQLARECEKRQALKLEVKRLEKAIATGDGGSFVEAACLWREAVEARRTIYFFSGLLYRGCADKQNSDLDRWLGS